MNNTKLRIFLLTSLLVLNPLVVQAFENEAYSALTKALVKNNLDKALLQELLCDAIESNDGETIELFFKFPDKFDIDRCNKEGINPLMMACGCNIELVKKLISHGASVHIISDIGISVLSAAWLSENSDMVDLIIKHGANVNQVLKEETTLLSILAANNDIDTMQFLIDRGAEINPKGITPLMMAAQHGHEEVAIFLLNHQTNVNTLDKEGRSALMYAIAGKNSKIVELLIQHGATFNVGNNNGYTPLMYGVLCNNSDAIILLINHGVDLDAVDQAGLTALMHAAWLGHSSVVELLIEKGADTSVQARPRLNVLLHALACKTATRQTIKKMVRAILAQNHAAVTQQAHELLEYNCRLEKPVDITILQDALHELELSRATKSSGLNLTILETNTISVVSNQTKLEPSTTSELKSSTISETLNQTQLKPNTTPDSLSWKGMVCSCALGAALGCYLIHRY